MASHLLQVKHPVLDALNANMSEIYKMETQTVDLINECALLQQAKMNHIANAKFQINECFINLINTLRRKQRELITELDTIIDPEYDTQSRLSSITTIINEQKHSLSRYLYLSATPTNRDSLIPIIDKINNDFNESMKLCDNHIVSIQESPSAINISIDNNRISQMISNIDDLVEIKNERDNKIDDTSYYYQEEIDDDAKTDIINIDLEDKIQDLENKLIKEREKYKRLNTEFLSKVGKYLTMESDSGVRWYDTNCLNNKPYQNWEPVLLIGTEMIIDTKGKKKKISSDSLLLQIPNIANLGEFHASITKLRNGYIKWITSIYKGNDDIFDIKKKDAEQFIIQYAQKNKILAPQLIYTKNESRIGGDVEAKLSFYGQIFTATARKKKNARNICYKMAQDYILNNIINQ